MGKVLSFGDIFGVSRVKPHIGFKHIGESRRVCQSTVLLFIGIPLHGRIKERKKKKTESIAT